MVLAAKNRPLTATITLNWTIVQKTVLQCHSNDIQWSISSPEPPDHSLDRHKETESYYTKFTMAEFIHTTLNPLDHLLPRNYVKSAAYLPLQDGISYQEVFDVLSEGLHRSFLQMPYLNGKVHWQSPDTPGCRPGQLEIRHVKPDIDGPRPWQLKYKELDTDVTYDEIKELGFPLDTFEDEDLFWADFLPDQKDGAEVLVGQINFMPGLCIISYAIHHAATDGMGSAMFPKIWADNCRGVGSVDLKTAAKAKLLSDECFDREFISNLIAREGNERPLESIDSSTWSLLDLEPPSGPPTQDVGDDGKGGPRLKPERVAKANIFYISPGHWNTLKELATEPGQEGQISGSDALYALIWRVVMRARTEARKSKEEEPLDEAKLEVAIDLRPNFSSTGSLPPMYLGNCILHSVIALPTSKLIATTDELPLYDIARFIREGNERFTPHNIQDAYTLLKHPDTDFRALKLRFSQTEGNDMMISSFLMFPMDQIVFPGRLFKNGGKIEVMRPLMGGFNTYFRMCFLLPRLASGGVEFVISLYEDEMEKLMEDEEFTKYASFCS